MEPYHISMTWQKLIGQLVLLVGTFESVFPGKCYFSIINVIVIILQYDECNNNNNNISTYIGIIFTHNVNIIF